MYELTLKYVGVDIIKLRCDYYHKNFKGNYQIRKQDESGWITYCTVSTEKQALEVVKYLKDNNWDKESLKDANFDFDFIKDSGDKGGKYYTKSNQNYRVQKNIDGKTKSFGHYDTEEEAKKVVEYLKMIKWDEELFEKHKKDLLNGKIL